MRPLGPLLDPTSIVIVGASPDPMRTGGIPIDTLLLRAGFPREKLLLVNPNTPRSSACPATPAATRCRGTPQLAVLAVPAPHCLPVLEQAHAAGIAAAVLFASGFAEGWNTGRGRAAAGDRAVRGPVRDVGVRAELPRTRQPETAELPDLFARLQAGAAAGSRRDGGAERQHAGRAGPRRTRARTAILLHGQHR